MKILAVDLSNLFRANWEATAGKELDGAFERTVSAVVRAREGFDRVAICCDAGPSFRKAIDPGYKAHRTPPPAAYGEQLRRTVERLTADGCSVFTAPAVEVEPKCEPPAYYAEADDVIAALCSWADSCYMPGPPPDGDRTVEHVRILGSDKDLLACVNEPGREGNELRIRVDVQRLDGAIFDPDAVEAKIGLPPHKVPEWLALAGDGSDGFKPFPGEVNEKTGKRGPGIGDKTAVALIKAHGTVTGIFDAIEDESIGDHARMILKKHGLQAGLRGLALATLRHDLPIDFSPLLAEPVVKPIPAPVRRFDDSDAARGAVERAAEQALAAVGVPAQVKVAPEPPEVVGEPVASTALAIAPQRSASGLDVYALQPRTLGSLWDTAQALYNSRLYPQYGNPEAIMAIAIEGNERGIPIGLALRNGYVVKGRPAWSAQFLAALVLASGKAEVFEIVESTAQKATLAYKRVGRPAREFTFTIEEAQKAGWLKSGDKGDSKWITNPRTMLRWAAIREAARAFFPDVCSGMYTPDEIRGHATDEDMQEDAA